jgi:hypothetical protein
VVVADVMAGAVIGTVAAVVVTDVVVRAVVAVRVAGPRVLGARPRVLGTRSAVAVLAGVVVAGVVARAVVRRGRLPVADLIVVAIVLRPLGPAQRGSLACSASSQGRSRHGGRAAGGASGVRRNRLARGAVVRRRRHHVRGPSDEDADQTATSVFDMVLIRSLLGKFVLAATIGGPRQTMPRGREGDGKRRVKPS